ncbi:MAG: hypothetical protein ABIT58_04070 [Ferruginibacter sp.]
MKKSVLSLALTLVTLCSFSQKTTRVNNYILPDLSKEKNLFIIEMSFADAAIIHVSGDTFDLQKAGNVFVDVICTDYPSGKSLEALNKRRIASFLARFPFVNAGSLSQVNFFRQTDGAAKEAAQTMFHGLVVRYRPIQSAAAMKDDIDDLDEIITSIERDTSIQVKKTPSQADKDSILLMVKLKRGHLRKRNGPAKYESKPYDVSATGYDRTFRSPYDSMLTMSPKTALNRGLISKAVYKSYDWTPWVTFYYHEAGDTIINIRKPGLIRNITVSDTLRKAVPVYAVPDSTLLKIFARNRWKKFTSVEDVTVSMCPYTAQLLLWLKIHTLDSVTKCFVFFNDGNEKPDDEKITGSTGGIYYRNCNSFDQVKKLLRETMQKGSGGDRAENDIEALLVGEKEFPANDFQVLIADNMADIRDKSLIKQLSKPVRVVLCGANAYNVNVDYLNLARETNGSLHLLDQDLYDLASLHDGQILKIGFKEYKIVEGAFVEMKSIDN